MKGFFYLLLATNLLFVVWQYGIQPDAGNGSDEVKAGTTAGKPGLRLLSELRESELPRPRQYQEEDTAHAVDTVAVELIEPEATARVEPEPVKTTSGSEACYRSAMLESVKEAEELQQALQALGVTRVSRSVVQTQKVNYWVMFSAFASRAKADGAAGVLRKGGVKDFFIVRSGRHENAISLGVYSTRERAELRYKEITALKSNLKKPVIEGIDLPAKRIVVKVRVDDPQKEEKLQKAQDKKLAGILEKIPCSVQ